MLRRIRHWLRAVFRRDQLEREMIQEMRQHLDISTERYVARGLPTLEARWAARREFGNTSYLEEQGRDARGATWVDSVRGDLRYAARALRASPAFATVAILSLAIGIGANTAIYSLINAVMLKSLPVERPGEIVQLRITDSGFVSPEAPGQSNFSNPMWEQIRDRTASYATYAVSSTSRFNLAAGGEVRRVDGMFVNGDFFNALGVRPALGRVFTAADDQRGCAAIAVISHSFWKSEFGGRGDVLGKPIALDGHSFTIIGVAAPEFFGVDVGQSQEVYAPICAEAILRGKASNLDMRSAWWLRVLARPRPGIAAAQYDARMRATSRAVFEGSASQRYDARNRANFLAQILVSEPAGNGISSLRKQYSKALLTLMGMVGMILLISCANVANLLLARGTARSREVAIRIAIGGSRTRLIRQFLTESLLLAIAGAAIGVVLANVGSRMLVGMLGSGPATRVALDLSLDLRVMGFTALVSVATVVLFGLAPAWRSTAVDPQSAMKAGGRGTIGGHSRFRIGKALVVAQSALALILVVGAGLLVGTFNRLATMDPGFKADGILIASFDFTRMDLQPAQYAVVEGRVLEQLRATPGVRAASTVDMTPVSGSAWNDVVVVDGFNSTKPEDHDAYFNQVGADYFRTMGVRLVEGRDFGREDTPLTPKVAIVSRAMAKRFFNGKSAVGKTYQVEDNSRLSPPVMIIGVVEDTKYKSMRETAEPIIYLPYSQLPGARGGASYVVSVTGSPSSVIGAAKAIAASVDPKVTLSFKMLSDQVARSLQRERVLATLSGFFGAVALLLAMIGLYGVMAYTVARRRVEIGIRIALGAARPRVVRLVLGDVGRMIALGILIGWVGALAATKVLRSFLFGVAADDPMTITLAVVVLASAALIAGAIPAGRAARLEPVEALRED